MLKVALESAIFGKGKLCLPIADDLAMDLVDLTLGILPMPNVRALNGLTCPWLGRSG